MLCHNMLGSYKTTFYKTDQYH